jgi:hypothetical protein
VKLTTKPASFLAFLVMIAALLALSTVLERDARAAVKARAYGAWVNLPNYGVPNRYVCDSGWLPSTGGNQSETAIDYDAGGMLTMVQGVAGARGDDEECDDDDDHAHIALGQTVVLGGYDAELRFDALDGRRHDDCCEEDDDDDGYSATFTGLHFAGQPVNVTGELNQVIDIPGVGRLIINEVEHRDDDDDDGHGDDDDDGHGDDDDDGHHDDDDGDDGDCDEDDYNVNALHLFPATGGEVIIGMMSYDRHDDDECCRTHSIPSTWGRIKTLYR